jgi:hypothetical protein
MLDMYQVRITFPNSSCPKLCGRGVKKSVRKRPARDRKRDEASCSRAHCIVLYNLSFFPKQHDDAFLNKLNRIKKEKNNNKQSQGKGKEQQ